MALDITRAIDSALAWSRREQHPEGYWLADTDSNCCMEAEWIMAMHFMGLMDDARVKEMLPGVVQAILHEQRQDGSWEVYYRAPTGDINTTVESYAALRIAGLSPQEEPLRRARQWIFRHGGLSKIRVFTRYWLALLGEWPWRYTPNLPPEIIFQPAWAPLSIYRFSAWARATIVPLTLLCSNRPSRPLPREKRLDELFPEGRERFDYRLEKKAGILSWETLFFSLDRVLNLYNALPYQPLRKTARRYCIDWVIRHQDNDGVWGGIQPPMIYSLMALYDEGYLPQHPVIDRGLQAFSEHWQRKREDRIYINATESIVWDTMLTMLGMLDCAIDPLNDANFMKALRWLLDKFVEAPGDWQVYLRDVEPGAWAFERANTWYPDVDDTAVALMVLARIRPLLPEGPLKAEVEHKMDKALKWTIAMQSKNGGWGAFDRDNNSEIVIRIPFSDFGEALDPPSVDVTAHVIEALGIAGMKKGHPVIDRALAFIRAEQEDDGSWFGRWGVNYIYGTAAVLPALRAIGQEMYADYVLRAADWIADHQMEDGGWGESCASYMDDSLRGRNQEATASQTAWALMALLAVGSRRYVRHVRRGLEWLLENQRPDGTWDEPWYTGTGFPGYGIGERASIEKIKERVMQGKELSRGFMVRYNMYRHYFPLMALGRAIPYLKRYRAI